MTQLRSIPSIRWRRSLRAAGRLALTLGLLVGPFLLAPPAFASIPGDTIGRGEHQLDIVDVDVRRLPQELFLSLRFDRAVEASEQIARGSSERRFG